MEYSEKTIEMAQLIAENCTSCKRCMKDCLFLQRYCQDPQKLFQQFLEEDLEPIVPYSCMLCGRCSVVCPLQLKLDEAFLAMRRDLIKEGLPLKELKSVVLHQKLSTSKLFTAVNRGEKK
ncbi:4Fe-4S dicluster domain-containing protein [Enterococcus dongliensis]|uniref:4Fe-4S dicluster domain-containing protein n=1 Tax=Enterococcus dongliensis TaxID=2559925 RepID=UPI0028927CAC|nr:4Fe-4S dicluster domain-containing protein [Enterococcus dongliensis]MDT2612099.1 4Fe-4S dicluster domain-containing protein [Enterococcus dongliensis]MDT2640396.1 4Fe-4S dicluster domain-containing protein [Enterococcus dongliensis]MDT2673701.1 4Fe-4S dicluster domain-containing protein [Enterococcus dongliensis]